MLSNKDLFDEITKINDLIGEGKVRDPEKTVGDNEFKKALLKANTLGLKLIHNLRTNQTRIMDKMGIEKIKPRRPEGENKSEKEGE